MSQYLELKQILSEFDSELKSLTYLVTSALGVSFIKIVFYHLSHTQHVKKQNQYFEEIHQYQDALSSMEVASGTETIRLM